jgi:hypothetical protein
MAEEQWIVKNNTKGPLILPKNKLTFPKVNMEKELCFTTGKTVDELERDAELRDNLKFNNLITVKKVKKEPVGTTDTSGLADQLEDLKKIIIQQAQNQPQTIIQQAEPQNIDTDALVDAIKSKININIGTGSDNDVVSLEDEKMREEALKNLVFKKDDKMKTNFKNIKEAKEVDGDSESFEDLMDDIDI